MLMMNKFCVSVFYLSLSGIFDLFSKAFFRCFSKSIKINQIIIKSPFPDLNFECQFMAVGETVLEQELQK